MLVLQAAVVCRLVLVVLVEVVSVYWVMRAVVVERVAVVWVHVMLFRG